MRDLECPARCDRAVRGIIRLRKKERGRRRTRQDQISPPEHTEVKLRTQHPHRTKKNRFLCRTLDAGEPLSKSNRPFDLMSRRHPLSSTKAFAGELLVRAASPMALVTLPTTEPPALARERAYFFLAAFLATFLVVFFAVFFTALFAVFAVFAFFGAAFFVAAFFAFLAMLPSDKNEMADCCCVHSGIEMHYFPNTPTHRKKQCPA
jgi:hypothetical protein